MKTLSSNLWVIRFDDDLLKNSEADPPIETLVKVKKYPFLFEIVYLP